MRTCGGLGKGCTTSRNKAGGVNRGGGRRREVGQESPLTSSGVSRHTDPDPVALVVNVGGGRACVLLSSLLACFPPGELICPLRGISAAHSFPVVARPQAFRRWWGWL